MAGRVALCRSLDMHACVVSLVAPAPSVIAGLHVVNPRRRRLPTWALDLPIQVKAHGYRITTSWIVFCLTRSVKAGTLWETTRWDIARYGNVSQTGQIRDTNRPDWTKKDRG